MLNMSQFAQLRGVGERLVKALDEQLQVAETAGLVLQQAKTLVRGRMKDFPLLVFANYGKDRWLQRLPLLPQARSGQGEFMDAVRRAAGIWRRLPPGGATAPKLFDGYGAEEFRQDVAGVWALWDAVETAELEVALARAELWLFYEYAAAAIAAYGHSVRGRLLVGNALRKSVPRTWKARRGE